MRLNYTIKVRDCSIFVIVALLFSFFERKVKEHNYNKSDGNDAKIVECGDATDGVTLPANDAHNSEIDKEE